MIDREICNFSGKLNIYFYKLNRESLSNLLFGINLLFILWFNSMYPTIFFFHKQQHLGWLLGVGGI